MKRLGRLSGFVLMATGGLCMALGLASFFVSLFTLTSSGLTLLVLGGFVFGLGVGIALLVQAIGLLSKLADDTEAIGSVARFLARRESAAREEDPFETRDPDLAHDAEHRVGLR